MPDAAVEAARLGLPYREPSTSRKKPNMKVSYIVDPTNPTAPPRRVFEKQGWFGRTFGKGVEWDQSHGAMPSPNSHSQAMNLGLPPSLVMQMPQPNQFGQMDYGQMGMGFRQTGQIPGIPQLGTLGLPQPLMPPPNLAYLPLQDRLAWERALKDDERVREEAYRNNAKLGKKWRKMEARRWKDEQRELERRIKLEMKEKKAKLKEDQARQKALLSGRKRWLPRLSAPPHPIPPFDQATATAATVVAAGTAPAGMGQERLTRWMMLPTGEEFGVRRPFDAAGRPPIKGPGDWPMMSRTMTHAVKDMSLEERVRAVQAGTVWGGSWGGQW